MAETANGWRRTGRGIVALRRLVFVTFAATAAVVAAQTQDSADAAQDSSHRLDARNGASDRAAEGVGYARVDGPIDRARKRYFSRAVDDARELGLGTLVVHIDTDGGAVFEAREMLKTALEQARDGPELVAFVDFRAISAGAMLAYGHDAVYLSETASIGDIGVIFVSREGEMEYAPEKVETVVRALLSQAAETRGWPRGPLLKMTARNQLLYRVTLPSEGGEPRLEYVIEDDLADFRAAHPDVDFDDASQAAIYRGKDRLLTLTGREALALGMASGIANDLDALYRELGVPPAEVIDLGPDWVERSAYALALLAPVLAGLAMLFVVFELKTPGVGLWALLGLVCGVSFLAAQYFQDLAEQLEVLLILVGMLLVVAEVLTMVGGGLLGLAGGAALFLGLLLAFLPNELAFDWSDPRFREAARAATVSAVGVFAVVAVGLLAFVYALPRSRLGARLALRAEITSTSERRAAPGKEPLRSGRLGVAAQMLRPAGLVEIDGVRVSATTAHGRFIEAGTPVVVVGERFGELVVRAAEPAEPVP